MCFELLCIANPDDIVRKIAGVLHLRLSYARYHKLSSVSDLEVISQISRWVMVEVELNSESWEDKCYH